MLVALKRLDYLKGKRAGFERRGDGHAIGLTVVPWEGTASLGSFLRLIPLGIEARQVSGRVERIAGGPLAGRSEGGMRG
jgi:hypothetical protein